MISEIKPGPVKRLSALVESKRTLKTRGGKDYWALSLRDKSGKIEARVWEIPQGLDIKVDDFVIVSGDADEWNEQLQIKVSLIDFVPENEVNIADFLPTAARPGQEMYDELLIRIRRDIVGDSVKALLLKIAENSKAGLLKAPAATYYHHAYIGGLLEHVLSLWGAASALASTYPDLDRDILLAGCMLHDIGKIQEMAYDRTLKYTTVGTLTGHVLIGSGVVLFEMARLKTPPEIRTAILHVIASHHGDEFGVVKPATREAVVFHYLDMIDSRMGGIRRALADDKEGGEFVKVPVLGGKQFYRGKV